MTTEPKQATGLIDESRAVVRVTGPDAETLLQGLLTNDVRRASRDHAVYAALLTPQGKYLFDMILFRPEPETFLLDVSADRAAALIKRLSMYRLRANATIEPAPNLSIVLVWGAPTAPSTGAVAAAPDPRTDALGQRVIAQSPTTVLDAIEAGSIETYHAMRLSAGVPLDGVDLAPEDTFPLDADFERLNGVDFKKGCYVGQEVTARMKHKTDRRKRLYRLGFDGPTPPSGADVTAGGKPAGVVGSALGDQGLAILRVDRVASGELSANDAAVTAEPID